MIIVLQSPNAGLEALARGLGAELAPADIGDMRSVRAAVAARRPKAVVSTVWRDWRAAEADPEAAFRFAGEAAINMAAAALEFDAAACLLSVSDVFGQAGGPFDPSVPPQPGSEFGDAARRAEVFFERAMRGRGLVVRSGPWLETIAHEVANGGVTPGGVRLQPLGAEALGRFVRELLDAGETGIAHAVPVGGDRSADETYHEVARRLGRAPGPTTPDCALAPRALLASPGRRPVPEVDPPAPSTSAAAEPGAGSTPPDAADPVVARRGPAALARYEGAGGAPLSLSVGPGGATLWLRDGKGVLERDGHEDRVLGPRRALEVDGPGALRFAPVTAFELYVLEDARLSHDADAAAAPAGSDPAAHER